MREGWEEVTIGELGQIVTGNTPPKNDHLNYGGEYPFIKPTDMEIGRRYCSSWEENYSEKAFKRYKNSYIPPKSTGVVTIGTVGDKLFQADRWCFTNQSVNVVIPNTELYDEDFIYYLMKINLPKVENANPGTASGRHHVSKSNFCAIKVQVPKSKETQKKIAAILSGYDDLIENNLKRIKILEEMAQQTYEEWFVRMRFPGYESAIINEETGLPEGWEKVRFGEIAEFKYGSMPKKENLVEKGFPVFSGYRLVGFSSKFNVSQKSIIIVARGVGGTGDVKFTPEKCWLTNLSILVKLKKDVQINYLYYYLKAANLRSLDSGAAQSQITIVSLEPYTIISPTIKIINDFNSKVEPVFKAIENLQNQNQRLREARDILLPRLMMGMIEV
ncbi:restriction endonuclease subunit S [Myroides odoratimimus]|uniref:restriction endonuclease subunit S n=1 Tax=Myroides odoratimimus TaxID=76832 RepID=UPI00257660C1|nr:restriction endonuclease subunit S [Myroides odoratimimus]MDM1036255.1 restriction endonuclease subunit S [Myroides odoratimimus]